MVEASAPQTVAAQQPPEGQPAAQAIQVPQTEIGMCEHEDSLATYCRIHDQALCNDCYFDLHGGCGRGMTLKQASSNQIGQFEELLNQTQSAFTECSKMKNTVLEQEGIEEEVIKKVQQQYDRLTAIVDEQREQAFLTIKHLESIQEYTPPPENFTQETLANLGEFVKDLEGRIAKQKQLSEQKNFFAVLKLRNQIESLAKQSEAFKKQIAEHKTYLNDNSRPNIVVRSEVDQFRGFLHDVVSFEPDFILSQDKPRLHYYDDTANQLMIHDLTSQTTTQIGLRNADILPKDFVSIQIHNKVFCIGGEKKENEIRTVVANDCFVINEQTYEAERRALMKYGRSGHQLAHLHKRFEYRTQDFLFATGSKYPDETAKKCEVYEVAKNKWTEIAEMNSSRHFHSICVLDGRFLYVIGGRDSQNEQPLDSIERLDGYGDLDKQKWEPVIFVNRENNWSARDTMGCFPLNDSEILIFGGDYGWISDCFTLNTKVGEIERMECSLKKPEEFFRAQPVRYNDKIFCVGCIDKDVHVYLPKAKKWFLLDKWYVDW